MNGPDADPPGAAATPPQAPALPAGRRAASPLDRLKREPERFSLDQAVAVLAPGQDPVGLPYRTLPRLGAPAGEVAQIRPETGEIVAPTFGLIGPGGVLPRHYTAQVAAEARKRAPGLHVFLDMLARRLTGLFVAAGAKYRPTRNPDAATRALAAATGLGTPHLADRLGMRLEAVLFHAGHLAARSRSAERLRGLLGEETGSPVRIVEFAGGWLRLPAAEQSRLPARGRPVQHARLGQDAALGAQVWDPSSRFVIRLGPLTLAQFEALLPGAPLHARLVALTRLQAGLDQDFAFNPVLAAAEVPALRLGGPGANGQGGGGRLGWTSWLAAPRPRRADAADALLRPAPPA